MSCIVNNHKHSICHLRLYVFETSIASCMRKDPCVWVLGRGTKIEEGRRIKGKVAGNSL